MISIDWGTRIISIPQSFLSLIGGTNYNLDTNAFRIALKDLEDSEAGMVHPQTHNHNTTVGLGGIDYARIIEIINGYTITFEETGSPYAVNLIGSNNNILDVVNLGTVAIRSNNSAGLVQTKEIQFGAFSGGITVDVINGVSGSTYPAGTEQTPVNNLTDAIVIADYYGFKTIFVKGNLTITSGDFSDGFKFKGFSTATTSIILEDLANINNCEFIDAYVSGIVDNNNILCECVTGDIVSFDGFLDRCAISGTITLGGSQATTLVDCYTSGLTETPPEINVGFGSVLSLSRYAGEIILSNKTGNEHIEIDLTSGKITLDSTVTNGTIQVRGVGRMEDNSATSATVTDELVNGAELSNLQRIVEMQRPHHISTGNIWYWDPYNGNDASDGTHISKSVKTFAQAHTLADNNNHDIILAIPGNPSGITTTTENIAISKNYIFLRGPGRDFRIASEYDNLDAVYVSGNGVEISGMVVSTSTTNTKDAIHTTGNFTLLKDLWISDAVNGVHFQNGEYGIAENVKMHHNLGYGLKFSGTSDHVDIIDCHIGSNNLDNVVIDVDSTTHEVNFIGHTVIHSSATGYGINISATTKGVIISEEVVIFNNFAGDINDLSSNTYNQRTTSQTNITDGIWNKPISEMITAGSIGEFVSKKILTIKKFIGLK